MLWLGQAQRGFPEVPLLALPPSEVGPARGNKCWRWRGHLSAMIIYIYNIMYIICIYLHMFMCLLYMHLYTCRSMIHYIHACTYTYSCLGTKCWCHFFCLPCLIMGWKLFGVSKRRLSGLLLAGLLSTSYIKELFQGTISKKSWLLHIAHFLKLWVTIGS